MCSTTFLLQRPANTEDSAPWAGYYRTSISYIDVTCSQAAACIWCHTGATVTGYAAVWPPHTKGWLHRVSTVGHDRLVHVGVDHIRSPVTERTGELCDRV
eukprot:jgi/Ulvmu1/5013/UM021_0030.1